MGMPPPGSGTSAGTGTGPLQAATFATRVWDAVKKFATISEQLKILEKEDARTQVQLTELGHHVLELIKEVREVSGQLKGIEKRLEDKDKLVEAIVELRVMKEVEKLRAEFARNPPT